MHKLSVKDPALRYQENGSKVTVRHIYPSFSQLAHQENWKKAVYVSNKGEDKDQRCLRFMEIEVNKTEAKENARPTNNSKGY